MKNILAEFQPVRPGPLFVPVSGFGAAAFFWPCVIVFIISQTRRGWSSYAKNGTGRRRGRANWHDTSAAETFYKRDKKTTVDEVILPKPANQRRG